MHGTRKWLNGLRLEITNWVGWFKARKPQVHWMIQGPNENHHPVLGCMAHITEPKIHPYQQYKSKGPNIRYLFRWYKVCISLLQASLNGEKKKEKWEVHKVYNVIQQSKKAVLHLLVEREDYIMLCCYK